MIALPALHLYLDEDVDVLLAHLLAARGFDCVPSVQLGHLAWSDEAHLDYAAQESWILITHNRRDFEQLAVQSWAQHKDHAGIVIAITPFEHVRVGAACCASTEPIRSD